jgi:hypothetical protein
MKFTQYICLTIFIVISKCFKIVKKEEEINKNEIDSNDKENEIIIKLTENYYNKIGPKNINSFRNMIFREINQKESSFDKHFYNSFDNHTVLYKGKNLIQNTTTPYINPTTDDVIHNKHDEVYRVFTSDYISSNRVIKFYISHTHECSIFINDTVFYESFSNGNFIEHMILHNNAESIDPKGVYSDDVNIKFFTFNRKMNIFQVYFDPRKKNTNTNTNLLKSNKNPDNKFNIEFDYDAINVIKSHFIRDSDAMLLPSDQLTETYNLNNSSNSSSSPPTPSHKLNNNYNSHNGNTYSYVANHNSFLWKILNQNFLKTKEAITIQIYFDLGKEFQHEDVEFSLNFTKAIIDDDKRNIVKYEWKGVIDPQEVLVLQAKFPLYFEHCGTLNINLVMIFIGAVFIIFLIGMLYIILSTVFLDEM